MDVNDHLTGDRTEGAVAVVGGEARVQLVRTAVERCSPSTAGRCEWTGEL